VFEKRMWLVHLSFRDSQHHEISSMEFSVMARTHWGACREGRRYFEASKEPWAARHPGKHAAVWCTVKLAYGKFLGVV
jgi:hypothetical protein